MRRRRGWPAALALAALILLAPVGAAGTEAQPDVVDAADKSDPTVDLLAAWFEPAPGGVLFTVKIGGASSPPPGRTYGVGFTLEGRTSFAIVAFDERGAARTDVRAPNYQRQGIAGPAGLRDALTAVAFTPGTPAYVSAVIPYKAVTGLAPGKVLTELYGGTGTWSERDGWQDADLRTTDNEHQVERTLVPVFVRRNAEAFTLGGVALLALVGAGLGYAIWRRRSARAPGPDAGADADPDAPARP